MKMTTIVAEILNIKKDAFKASTEHEFLYEAGDGILDVGKHNAWLSQNYVYILSSLRFIEAQVMVKRDYSSSAWLRNYYRLLAETLYAITLELEFFESQVKKYALNVEIVGGIIF